MSRGIRSLSLSTCIFVLTVCQPLLAEDAAILVGPQELHAGGQSAFTVTTLDDATRAAIARPVVVTLLEGERRVSTLFVGGTGLQGHVHVPFQVPALDAGSYTMEAQVVGVDDPLRLLVTVSHAPAILIETDKPIYKPAQTIQGRVLLVDNALRPTSGEVEVSIHDAKGIRIDRRELTANEYGVADFSLDLASEVNFGVWKIRARSESVESVRDVRVEEYTLPRFDLSLSFPRSWALVDENITGTVNARYFFGRDVEGAVVLSAKRWVGAWEEFDRVEGSLSGGELAFSLSPVGFVAGSPGNSGQGSVTLDVEVTDSTGHTQSTTDVLTITESSLVLGLIPRASYLKPEIPFEVLVTGRTPEGEALDAQVTVNAEYFGEFGDSQSVEQATVAVVGGSGMAAFSPPPEAFYADLTASASRDGRSTSTSVRLEGTYSSGSSFVSLTRDDGEGPASVGSQLSFSTVSTHPGTVYYEVYAGGRTVFSEASESDSFSLAVTTQMMPKARVVAYKINPNNEIAADSLSFDVRLSSSIEVVAVFDHEEVKPGDPVEVTIDAGTGERTLLGVSIVDQSVLALGRSRLHLAEVFGELERRFLEPKAEAHEPDGGEGPGGPAPGGIVADMWSPPRIHGAEDVLEEAGLQVVTSGSVWIQAGRQLWDDLAEADGPPQAVPGAGPSGTAPPAVRVRQFFPETWVWQPLLLTDESGRATLSLTAPDSITSWKLSVVTSSSAGIGFGESDLTAFQDFFVEPSLPSSVTRNEEFPIKVDVFNYLDEVQDVALSFGESEWFELLGDGELQVSVPPNSATSVHFPIRPGTLGEHDIEVTAIGSTLSDAVRRKITVSPEGVPTELVFNGVIEPGDALPLDLSFPHSGVEGSERAFLHVTPSPVAQTMEGVSDLLDMPYGCGEQNMIFLAPDIEILKYLREIGELSTEIRATAEYYVNVGYQRQLTFQTEDGGFAAFGGAEGSLWLTAFVLSTFSGAREVRDIDEAVLARAAGMLVSRQNPDGSFLTDDFLIHKEMDGGLENLVAMAAYVTNALTDYAEGGQPADEVLTAISQAAAYLRDTRSSVNDDAYSLSIVAVALGKVSGFEAESEAVIDRLLELAIDEGVGLHWEPYPVETTGYAAMALLTANGGAGRPQAGLAVDWLSTQRNALGGYGQSTQDTVVAIRTLFLAASKANRDLNVNLSVVSGAETIWSLVVNATNFDLLHTTPLPSGDGMGEPFELRASGSGNVGYQVVKRFNLPGEELPPPKDMLIGVEYRTAGIAVDDILEVRVRLLYGGYKERTGMVIADIGVPTGFAVVRVSTDALIENGIVSRIEIAGRKVIFYLDSLLQNEAFEFSFEMLALYPVRAEGPISQAYEYYDNDIQAHHRMGDVNVFSTPGPRFFRGDANLDLEVDLSDAIRILYFLFVDAEASPLLCEDAADTDDSGELDITDPIYLLQHLFVGGPPPRVPYTEMGLDPTPDSLSCGG